MCVVNRRVLIRSGGVAVLAGLAHGSATRTNAVKGKEDFPAFRVRFVRHAQSQIDVLRTIDVPGQPLPADSDMAYPLTQVGMEQAVALAETLRTDRLLALFASPRLRCVQTADALGFARGMAVELAPGTEEVGFIASEASMSTLDYAAVMQTMTRWMQGDLDARTRDGESLAEVRARFLPVVQAIIDRYAAQNGDLIVVSHGIVLAAALPMLFANLTTAWTLANMLPATGMATGAFVDGALICTDWNGASPG